MPKDAENIVTYCDLSQDEDFMMSDNVLLLVHKPKFETCPEPAEIFASWLKPGWNLVRNEVKFQDENPETGEFFTDDSKRVQAYNSWLGVRDKWVERQKILYQTRALFDKLHEFYFKLKNDSENLELIIANGILCDKNNSEINHPLITKRVKIDYDSDRNDVIIEDSNSSPEIYSGVFQGMKDVNLSVISQLRDEFQANEYHPFNRKETPAFLKCFVHQLSHDSCFSQDGIPTNWKNGNRLLLYMEPVFILRDRLNGTLKAIEEILDNISGTGYIPKSIDDIVGGGKVEIPDDTGDRSIEETLAAVGGESVDVLLSKEANKEQLEIAKRIENYNAVVVQGPPGTGKTHTIANLMGHFLAQGKSVLVTSHTSKALKVLKDKIDKGVQNLCVSVLDDSNIDMERSINGITNFMSRHTSVGIKDEVEQIAFARKQVIADLADVRRKIFAIINNEANCIVYNGEEISPSKAASFVAEHQDELSYIIPGTVKLDSLLPLSMEELRKLYSSNDAFTITDEAELAKEIPNPDTLLSPDKYAEAVEGIKAVEQKLHELSSIAKWNFEENMIEQAITFNKDNRNFTIPYPEESAVSDLKSYIDSFGKFEPWMIHVVVDGKNGGSYRKRWEMLIEQIQRTCDYAASLVEEQLGKKVCFGDEKNIVRYIEPLKKLQESFNGDGKIAVFKRICLQVFSKECLQVREQITINGQPLQFAKDCEIALHMIKLEEQRLKCAQYWDDLLARHGVTCFFELATTEPERIAKNWIPDIRKYLDWYENVYTILMNKLEQVGIPDKVLFEYSNSDSDEIVTEKILSTVGDAVPQICEVCSCILEREKYSALFVKNIRILDASQRAGSNICHNMITAMESRNTDSYADVYYLLLRTYKKYEMQNYRVEMLSRLEEIAPEWAIAIKNRDHIHGSKEVPSTIEKAWKWKQLEGIIEGLLAESFAELQEKSIRLSKKYRQITAQYAEKKAWYHLLRKTEGDKDIQQALEGWRQTVKKIGKGTGKNVAMYRAKAKGLMEKCQLAVPSWIMPINRALENLNPQKNQFDVIIIDEASQSDISSLAILYMGKKLIIVGDDKQVSPMAIGTEIEKINDLQQVYIKDKIPNAHLYDAKTSIYDIAKTTFHPLMLQEHFRCVPEIIGFSNMLSYDYKIKPLRDTGNDSLLPAVVNYRVAKGQRQPDKTNPKEAEAIVALLQSCIQQPEYAGKTFGIISLLGDEQVNVIQRLIMKNIAPKVLEERQILWGNAANFQGDERDVIFLSMVDSVTADNSRPIRMQTYGTDDAYRKRYNVAVSRAKDQLWVVHSLDASTDLKDGDIRKTLLDYSIDPTAAANRRAAIAKKADSPFEVAVVQALVNRGYRIVQQWEVGAYRLDMVAVCGKKRVAIECDGERYHSGEAKIREDMQRQTILERLGWRFIRIRGSEYFRNPETTIERVVSNLAEYGIEPEEDDNQIQNMSENSELLDRVKACAARIMSNTPTEDDIDFNTVAAALDMQSTSKLVGAYVHSENHGEKVEKLPKFVPAENNATTIGDTKEATALIKSQRESTSPSSAHRESMPKKQQMPEKKSVSEKKAKSNRDVLELLERNGIQYIGKRDHKGALWILGGMELAEIVKQCKQLGMTFTFKKGGGIVTKGKPGWWAK